VFKEQRKDLFDGDHTGDDFGQLGGDDGLSHSVERKVELFDHVTGVLGSAIHGNHSSSLLGDVILLDQSEDQGSHVELGVVSEDGLVDGIEDGEIGVAQRVDGVEGGVGGHLLHC